jgi:hypothetical protein
VKKAKAAAPAAGVDRALIDALALRYTADPAADRAKLDEAYANAMRDVHKKFPADDDVSTLFAEAMMDLRPWKFWNADGTAAPAGVRSRAAPCIAPGVAGPARVRGHIQRFYGLLQYRDQAWGLYLEHRRNQQPAGSVPDQDDLPAIAD